MDSGASADAGLVMLVVCSGAIVGCSGAAEVCSGASEDTVILSDPSADEVSAGVSWLSEDNDGASSETASVPSGCVEASAVTEFPGCTWLYSGSVTVLAQDVSETAVTAANSSDSIFFIALFLSSVFCTGMHDICRSAVRIFIIAFFFDFVK